MGEMKKSDKGKDEIIKSLRLFNEKADKLMSLGFTKPRKRIN
jgi:Fe2+ transport system protein FeoA